MAQPKILLQLMFWWWFFMETIGYLPSVLFEAMKISQHLLLVIGGTV